MLSQYFVAAIIMSVIAALLVTLAIWRWHEVKWGGAVWLAALTAMIAIRLPHGLRNRKNMIVLTRSDWVDKILLTGMALSGGALPLAYLASSAFTVAGYSLPEWVTAVGAILVLPALWLSWRSHANLGRNWSPSLELREGHDLITHGTYRYIRHPMYAAIWLWSLAQPLLIHNWIAGALIVPAFSMLYFIRRAREEAMMREQFGKAYIDYAARTSRLLPKFISP